MTVIQIPDREAESLSAKAAEQGLSLEDWIRKLAGDEPSLEEKPLDARPISEVIAEIMKDVPAEEFAKLPKDGASQVDHYVYGLPKRD